MKYPPALAAAVTPIMKFDVADETLIGSRSAVSIAGIFNTPEPMPSRADIRPAPYMSPMPSGTRVPPHDMEAEERFREMAENLVRAAKQARSEPPWKAIVKTYLSLEYCDHAGRGCPLAALAPELARVDKSMRGQIFAELVNYKDRMVPFMPGQRTADKERAFFSIFSTMIGATEIARMLPEPGMREKVLASARDFLLRSF